jgi:hypothetical protein
MSWVAEYGTRAYGGGAPILDGAIGPGTINRSAADNAFADDSVRVLLVHGQRDGFAYITENVGVATETDRDGVLYIEENVGVDPLSDGEADEYVTIDVLDYTLYYGDAFDSALADDVGATHLEGLGRHPFDNALAIDNAIVHPILQPSPPPPPPPPPPVLPPPPPIVTGILKKVPARPRNIRPAKERVPQNAWASDVRVSQPIAPDNAVLRDLGGFAFTSGGLAHGITEGDIEELFLPTYSPHPTAEH